MTPFRRILAFSRPHLRYFLGGLIAAAFVGLLDLSLAYAIKTFIIEKVVMAGIQWLIGLLNPAAAFVKACKMIYDVIMWFVERAEQIKEFVESILDSTEAILAGAIGNAMGSPVESMMYWEIDEKYPGGIQTILDPRRLEREDDNQMAMLLTETYLARAGQPVMARHFGAMWKENLNRNHFFPLCMGRAYDLICQGWDPRITGHWSVVTGSTVMCMEPVGIYNIADPAYASMDATAISYMYQRGLDMQAAANLAATVAEALRPEATVDSVCQAALDTAPDTRNIASEKPHSSNGSIIW